MFLYVVVSLLRSIRLFWKPFMLSETKPKPLMILVTSFNLFLCTCSVLTERVRGPCIALYQKYHMELLASEGSTATVLQNEAGQQGEAGIWFPDGITQMERTTQVRSLEGRELWPWAWNFWTLQGSQVSLHPSSWEEFLRYSERAASQEESKYLSVGPSLRTFFAQ